MWTFSIDDELIGDQSLDKLVLQNRVQSFLSELESHLNYPGVTLM